MENQKFLIWSVEHKGWWLPDSQGYVVKEQPQLAGRYTLLEAVEICNHANIACGKTVDELMVPEWEGAK